MKIQEDKLKNSRLIGHPSYPRELLDLFVRSTKSVGVEYDTQLAIREGVLPPKLRGELFRNGPGRFAMGRDPYAHPFDGDGMVSKFTFLGGAIEYKNKYVQTRELVEEMKAGRMLYRSFGTNIPGGFLKNMFRRQFKNAANTNIIKHGGKLLALWEGGWPHSVDPQSLSTLERFDFSGGLKNDFGFVDSLINPELPFSAHPKVDPATGILYNFGTVFGIKNRLMFLSISPDGKCLSRRFFYLKSLSFIHDFVLTSQGMALVFCSPVQFDILTMITGLKSPAEGISGDPRKKVTVLAFPLDGAEGQIPESEMKFYELPYSFIFHHINAFEVGDDIIVYSAEMEEFPDVNQVQRALQGKEMEYPTTRLVRYIFSKKNGGAHREVLPYQSFELPRISEKNIGKEFSDFFAVSSRNRKEFPFLSCVDRVDLEGRRLSRNQLSNCLVGEPVLAGDVQQYVLTLNFNGRSGTSELLILDSSDLRILCRAELPHSQPLGFHGNWYL